MSANAPHSAQGSEPVAKLELIESFQPARQAQAPLKQTLRNLLLFPFQGRTASNSSGERLLGETLATWMDANYWNHEQLSTLTRSCTDGRLSVSSKELEDLTKQKAVNPRPRLFRALAAIHGSVAAERCAEPGQRQPPFAVGDLVRFATALTSDDAGNKASWWFALYCHEPWARERIGLRRPTSPLSNLSSRLSSHLRQQIVHNGQDPVSVGKAALGDLFIESHAKANLLHLWLMGMRELGPDEVHDVIHPVLHILRSHGSEVSTVKELLDSLEQQG